MIKVFIPRYRMIEEDHGKSHMVYEIDVYVSGRHHKLEKRYRAFHHLHKQLKKIMITPEFPPKKMRNWNAKVLEQRRDGLESYVQTMVKLNPTPLQLAKFLNVPLPESFTLIEKKNEQIVHKPILVFKKDPFIESTSSGELPDIVAQGIMLGLFTNE